MVKYRKNEEILTGANEENLQNSLIKLVRIFLLLYICSHYLHET